MLKLSSSTSNEAFLREGISATTRGRAISAYYAWVCLALYARENIRTHVCSRERERYASAPAYARACVTLYVTIITHGTSLRGLQTSSYNAVTLHRSIFDIQHRGMIRLIYIYIYTLYIYPQHFFFFSFIRFPIRRHEAYGLHSSI